MSTRTIVGFIVLALASPAAAQYPPAMKRALGAVKKANEQPKGATAPTAESGVLASALVYQYGGPQTRTRCVSTRVLSDNPITGKIIVCDGYATDAEQHALYLDWYAPNVANASDQVKSMAQDCLRIGVAAAVAGTILAPSTAVSFWSDKVDTVEASVKTCVAATTTLGTAFGAGDVDIRTRRKDFWF